ncbi:hypothetical protein TWF281_000593 [Arthrobotrys megalospora]
MCPGCRHRAIVGDDLYAKYNIQKQLTRPELQSNKLLYENPTSSSCSKPKTGLESLPLELITEIFSYLLYSPTGIGILYFPLPKDRTSFSTAFQFRNSFVSDKLCHSTGLFLTSRYISDIALTVLYSSNEFSLQLEETLTRPWLISIGVRNRNRLTRLRFWKSGSLSNRLGFRSREFEHEFVKIGCVLQTMQKLRRVYYSLGEADKPGILLKTPNFNIPTNEIPQLNKTLMLTHRGRDLSVDISVTSNPPFPLISMEEKKQDQSGLLSLPEPILRKILGYCYTSDRISLSSPFNHQGKAILSSSTRSFHPSYAGQYPSHFSLFFVCKSLYEKMREIVYSSTTFKLQNHAFVVFSDLIRAQDFDRVTKLELVLGHPEMERLVYNLLCLKAIVHKLAQPSSNIQQLDIKMHRLCVPYLSIFRDLLVQLNQKCEVKIGETENMAIGEDGVEVNDIGWMLNVDTDSNTTWAWGHRSKKWTGFKTIEKDIKWRKRWENVGKTGLYVGIWIGVPLAVVVCSPILVPYFLVKGVIDTTRRRRRRRS